MKIETSLKSTEWSTFVENHPNGNIFQTQEMYNFYKKTKKYDPLILGVIKNGEIIGLLLSVVQKQYNGPLGELTKRDLIFGGPLVLNDDPAVLDMLLKEYIIRIRKKAIFSEIRNQWDLDGSKEIFKKNGFNYLEHLDILIKLEKGEEQLWNEMARARRKGINQAFKKIVLIKEIDLLDEIVLKESYEIIKSVYKRIKLPFHDYEFFKQSKSCLGSSLKGFGAFSEDKMVGVRLVLCFKSNIYDWYAGALDDYLSFRPNDILPWALMKYGVKNGYKIFDFGGAGEPNVPYGVRDFKLKFGGELVEFGRFQMIHKPKMMSLAKLGLSVYKKIK